MLALTTLVLISQGIACSDQPDGGIWVELDCSRYCARANECNEEVNEGECEDRCLSALANCQADEREAAQNQIDECSDANCDDLVGCTVDAGARCYFGL
ncbi:hypothetical protein [Paraliomyxa miuraensis]|uniref:hypothetical protein n=1 Tax=Paraliomyxa miuraensis TaxID=376150 RepID=UPI00225454FF|nr:hypothetical protein [Paraliomyxa miuraensis]MCX4240304.1 hypothetical protein [Paraliomyxa miuraensis]